MKSKSKVGDLSQGLPEGSFPIATTPRCRRGRYFIHWKVKLATLVEGDLKAPFSIATTVVYWPSTRPNIHRKEVTHSDGSYEKKYDNIADNMGQGKIPWYTHRLMYRKRVTCELHDSYFCLMTIKHAIPKIEWAIELLYNSVKTGSQSWRSDELTTRCSRESQHSAESWALRPPGWAAQENRKETRLWPIVWGSIYCSSVWSPTPSHTQPFQIKWEVYFIFKEVFARLYYYVNMSSACICVYMYIY